LKYGKATLTGGLGKRGGENVIGVYMVDFTVSASKKGRGT